MPSDWRELEATNETIFRSMNEWAKDRNDERRGPHRPMDSYLCECSDRRCSDPIRLTRSEYESVRAAPGIRFAIALNHENPEIDLVLSENLRFATVEKYGAGARIARASDPRRG